ncbi:Glyco_hydro_32N domain-containing protein [Meloidogyne graminicola]|uniref:beta-fructofuranosidase n=1 Tax=Meloidogyne graminicola TaxID=189291 RepID=A0A8S9ZGD0_9BILA|nr:Glyco_hydro_32N domain-containing protein [Meloidogyne graminicola]
MDSPTPQSHLKPSFRKKPLIIIFIAFCAFVIVSSITFGLLHLIKNHNSQEFDATTISSIISSTQYYTTDNPPFKKYVYVHVNLINTSVLHIWLKPKLENTTATLYANVSKTNSNESFPTALFYSAKIGPPTWFDFVELELNITGIIELSWSEMTTIVSYIYTYEPEEVKFQGIRPAYISKQAMNPPMDQSFHFRPPLGWINDPNGFSRTRDGLYHLYYQHYPHSKRWSSMYWGHAISYDLVNWIHQPIFLRPNDKECGENCGCYSGSAVPNGNDGLQVFFTDNNNTRNHQQIQRTIYTKDTIAPSNESEIILNDLPDLSEKELKLSSDFRDPNVFISPDGYHYMTLGSGDTLGWQFQNVIKTDNLFGTKVCECSQIFQLGDKNRRETLYALLYARMGSKDDDGRSNLTPIILGTFNGTHFEKIYEQELDFAAGSFGVQAFYDPIADEALLLDG